MLIDTMGAEIVAVVGDNHSGIQKALALFCENWKNVYQIRCVLRHFTVYVSLCSIDVHLIRCSF